MTSSPGAAATRWTPVFNASWSVILTHCWVKSSTSEDNWSSRRRRCHDHIWTWWFVFWVIFVFTWRCQAALLSSRWGWGRVIIVVITFLLPGSFCHWTLRRLRNTSNNMATCYWRIWACYRCYSWCSECNSCCFAMSLKKPSQYKVR